MASACSADHRVSRPFLRTFVQGGTDVGGGTGKCPGFHAPIAELVAAIRGVMPPWTVLASCALSAWPVFSRAMFRTEDLLANRHYLVEAMVITVAVRPWRRWRDRCGS